MVRPRQRRLRHRRFVGPKSSSEVPTRDDSSRGQWLSEQISPSTSKAAASVDRFPSSGPAPTGHGLFGGGAGI